VCGVLFVTLCLFVLYLSFLLSIRLFMSGTSLRTGRTGLEGKVRLDLNVVCPADDTTDEACPRGRF